MTKHPLYLVKYFSFSTAGEPVEIETDFKFYNDAIEFAKELDPKAEAAIYELARLGHYVKKGKEVTRGIK